jgi:hypothetical protein
VILGTRKISIWVFVIEITIKKKKQIKTNHELQIPINTTLNDLIEKKRKSIT